MATWIIASLLVPLFLNQIDVVVGKLMKLYSVWKYRR